MAYRKMMTAGGSNKPSFKNSNLRNYERDFERILKDTRKSQRNLDRISQTGGREGSQIRRSIADLKSQQRSIDADQRRFLGSYKTELDAFLRQGEADVKSSQADFRSRTRRTGSSNPLLPNPSDLLAGLTESNRKLKGLSKKQAKLSEQTAADKERSLSEFSALTAGKVGGPSQVDIAAKQKRARDLRTQAKLLSSLRGGAGSVRDYLSRVESADIDAIQQTAAERAGEYYQRRAQLQQELSAKAVAENYYNTQQTQQLLGAAQTQAEVSKSYTDILSAVTSRDALEQDLFFNQAEQMNRLLGIKTQALGQYGALGAGIFGDIGQRSIQTAGTEIAGFGDILGKRIQAGIGAGNLGIGGIGAISDFAGTLSQANLAEQQAAWNRYIQERDFTESKRRDQRDYDFQVEARDYQRKQYKKREGLLREYSKGKANLR